MSEDPNYARVSAEVRNAAKDKVSRLLIQNWNNLRLAMPELPETPPTAAQMMGDPTSTDTLKRNGIAGELITNRRAMIGDKELKLEDLSAKVDALTKDSTDPMMVGMRTAIAAFPDEEVLKEISEASMRGLNKQSGIMNSIGNFLMALFSWIGSMFSDNPISFSEAMANVAAPGIRDSVQSELQALANDPSKASSQLLNMQDEHGHTSVDIIADTAFRATYKEMEVAPPALPAGQTPPIPLDQVRPQEIVVGNIRTTITNQILNPPPGPDGSPTPSLSNQIYDILAKSRDEAEKNFPISLPKAMPFRSKFIPDDGMLRNDADTISRSIARTIVGRMSDPAFRVNGKKLSNLPKEEFSAAMAEEVAKDIEKLSTNVKIDDQMPELKKKLATRISAGYDKMQSAMVILGNASAVQPPTTPHAARPPAPDLRSEAIVTGTLASVFDITEAQELRNIPGVKFFNPEAPAGVDKFQSYQDFGKTPANLTAIVPINPASVSRMSIAVPGEAEPHYYKKIAQNGATGDAVNGVNNTGVDNDVNNKGFKGVAWIRTDKEGTPLLVKGEAEIHLSFAGYKSNPLRDTQQTLFAKAMEQGRLSDTVSQVPAFMTLVRDEVKKMGITSYATHIGAHSMGSANAQAAGAIAEATKMNPVATTLLDPVTASLADTLLRKDENLKMLGISVQQLNDALSKTTSIRTIAITKGMAYLSNAAMLKVIDPNIPLPAGDPATKQRIDAIHVENMGTSGTGLGGIAGRLLNKEENSPTKVNESNRTVGTEVFVYMDVDKMRSENPIASPAAFFDPTHALSHMMFSMVQNTPLATTIEKVKTAVLLSAFDASKDGKVSKEEVQAATESLKIIRGADTNKDGNLSVAELAALTAVDKDALRKLAVSESLLKANKLDTEKASIDEVMAALKTLGVEVTTITRPSTAPGGTGADGKGATGRS